MHSLDFDISLENMSKIEGHADLDIKVKDHKVKNVELKITENKRFFTRAVRGKPSLMTHRLVSRICGTCSTAHLTACIETVEEIYEHVPSQQTMDLRNLMLYGLNIRDHAMHLFLFCLPDIFGKDSVLEFADDGKEHELLHEAFDIKSVGNKLDTLVGGKPVHAPFPVPGGFIKTPTKEELKAMVPELQKIRNGALEFVDIFHKCDFEFIENNAEFIAIKNKDFAYLGDGICSTDHYCIAEEVYINYLSERVIPYSQAAGFKYKGRPYLVGALARVNLNGSSIHPDTKKSCSESLKVFPSNNIFHNNLAQAIEIVNCIDRSIEIIERLELKAEPRPELKLGWKREGVGVIEAPRGTLYYHLRVDDEGKVKNAELVIPTAQNQVNMEKNIGSMVQQKLDEGMPKEKIKYEVEKLVRAYDPCMSCATHFLKLNWL
ncbi:MAG: Ni/Fe hydrogenase subunit alpha [Candidatus Micrarchaeota archaeon]